MAHWSHLIGTVVIVVTFHHDGFVSCLKTGPKRPFFNTKLAIERGRRLAIAQNLLQVMRICSMVGLSHLYADF